MEVTGVAPIITGTLTGVQNINGTITVPKVISPESYEGSYNFTPSDVEQVIPIEGKMANQDITINPIPSNYGLITWNGSTLTVS